MAWVNNSPKTTTKLRLAPSIITGNWQAIETGGVPYDKLQLEQQGATPTRQNSRGWLYAKNPGTGFTELYYLDDRATAVETQLISNGRIGIPTQGVNALNLIMDSTSFTYAKNQMIVATGSFDLNGILQNGVNMSTHATNPHPGTGQYNVSVDADVLLNASYQVIATCNGPNSTNFRCINWITKATPSAGNPTNISFRINSDAGAHDRAFDVIIVGGR